MTAAVSQLLAGEIVKETHYWATCFKVTRVDGTILRVTDHDVRLVVGLSGPEGVTETFVAAGGMQASAVQGQGQLADKNLSILGILTSGLITFDDLRAGRYREAKVEIYRVDWRVPWRGYLSYSVYWVDETTFDGERWNARLSGRTRKLQQPIGRIYSVLCDAILGDSRCGFNLAGVTVSAKEVETVVTQRRVITCTNTSLNTTSGYYDQGRIVWTSGANNGLSQEILLHEHNQPSAGKARFSLWLEAPFDVAVGDDFTVEPGCAKRAQEDCKTKFSNLANFRAFPFLPGTDDFLESPP